MNHYESQKGSISDVNTTVSVGLNAHLAGSDSGDIVAQSGTTTESFSVLELPSKQMLV